jgi:hypothetical protein
LASIAAVLTKDPDGAEKFATEALSRAQSWYLVRAQAAKVKYLLCIVPHFPMWHHLDWPVPPKSEYLKADSQSIEHLENAAEEFDALLNTVEINDNEKRLIQVWRLACLSCNPRRRREASAYANHLIASDPNHIPAVLWAIHKGFDFDRRSFFAAFKGDRAWNQVLPGDVQAVVAALFQDEEFQKAIEILEAAKTTFEDQKVGFLWRFLRGQLAASQKDTATTAAILLDEQDLDHKRDLRLAILRTDANRTHSLKELGQFLEECYNDTARPAYLFEACEVWLRSGQPMQIVKHRDALLHAYPTATALRLVIQACFDAHEFEVCLQLLRDRRDLFPSGDLPPPLRRVEIECLRQQGELTTAASIAEGLAAQQTDTETLVTLFQTQVSMGDLRAGSITARNLANRPEIAPFGLLQVARLVQSEDQALAVSLWEEAVRRGVDYPPALVTAVDLGFRLGLDDRLQPLMPKFYALSQQPGAPVSAHAIDDIRALMEKVQQEHANVARLYGQGSVPLHLVAGRINTPFAVLLCEQGRINVDNRQPLREAPLLIRAGSKAPINPRSRKPHRFMVDISSLLIADFLGILDTVEAAFSPLLISAHVPDFLREQIEKTLPHQPARQSQREAVIKLVEEKRLGTVSLADLSRKYGHLKVPNQLLLDYAKTGKRVFCDFGPQLDDDFKPVALKLGDTPFFTTCNSLANAAFAMGAISQAQFQHARARLLPTPPIDAQFSLIPEQEIILGMGVAEHLFGAGLLETLSNLSRVIMPEEDVQSLRAESEGHRSRLRVVDWLRALQDRARVGLIKGKYKTVHRQRTRKEKERPPNGSAEHCIWDLLNAKAMGARLVWCDDRFLSRYEKVGKLPSIGILEMLRLLRNDKTIDEDHYFGCLMRLRDANARYLPVFGDEVSYHLARAPIVSGAVTETPSLVTLRRYIASCCLDKERLQPPFVANGKQLLGEFNWVIEGMRAIAESIAKLWEQEGDEDQLRETRADWLLNNLFVPYLAVFEAQGRVPLDDGLEGYAGTIALLLSAGFYLPSHWSTDATPPATSRVKFYRWVESRFLAGIQHVEPTVIKRLAEIESNSLVGLSKMRDKGKPPENMIRAFVAKALLDLPPSLQSRLSLADSFRRWLRLTEPRDMMGISGHEFEAAAVYKAMAAACTGKIGTFKSVKGDEFEIPPRDQSLPPEKVYIKGPGFPDKATLHEPRLPALVGTAEERQKFLISKTTWFDIGRQRMERAVEDVIGESDPIKIFARIDANQDKSAEKFYRSVFARLHSHETVRLEESFPPTAASLIDHLRLSDESFSSTNVCFDRCAERLINEIGLGPALERFAALPVLLPAPFWKSIRELSSKALAELVDAATDRLLNPVSRIQLIHILADRSAAVPDYLNRAKDVLADVLDHEAGDEKWKTFAELLEWTHRVFQLRQDFRNLDPAILLAITWLHAGRLCDTLLGVGIDQPKVRNAVRNAVESIGLDLAAHNKVFWFDAMHPRNVARFPVLLRGIGAVASAISPEARAFLRLHEAPWTNPTVSSALLLRDTSLAGNLLNSFIGGNATVPLHAIFTEAALAKVQPIASGEVVERSIRELEENAADLSRWHVVNLLIGDLPLPETVASLLESVIGRTAFADLLKDKPDHDHLIFHFACSRVASGMSDDVRAHLEKELFRLVESYKGITFSDLKLRNRGGLAIGCLLQLAMNVVDEKELFRRYHESLTKIIWQWPEIRKLVAQRFGGWPLAKPLVRQRGFWEMELTLRALS